MDRHFNFGALAIVVGVLLLTGCATKSQKPPLWSAPDFKPESMDTVYVLPVIDTRPDKTLSLDSPLLQTLVTNSLKRNSYDAIPLSDSQLISGITDDVIETPRQFLLERKVPSTSRWIMMIIVHQFSRTIDGSWNPIAVSGGSLATADVSIVLFDNSVETIVWKDRAYCQFKYMGLIGVTIGATTNNVETKALLMAREELMGKFPKMKKGI